LPMGFRETCAVEERMRFVMAAEAREEPFAALCRQFGVSRRVGYKWLGRYREDGVEGLQDRSRAPLSHPHAIAHEISERCIEIRRAHPTWGPLKARAFLARREPEIDWPAASTIGGLFDREGLTVKRRLRRRSPPSSAPFGSCAAANDTWCIDFKGWFVTGDGARCEPLTLTDAASRYLLRCQALARNDVEHVWPVIDAAFRLGRGRRLVAAFGSRDQGRGGSGADRARQAAAERAPRAHASDAAQGRRHAAGCEPARATRGLARLSAPLQRFIRTHISLCG
jgi:putative transposase